MCSSDEVRLDQMPGNFATEPIQDRIGCHGSAVLPAMETLSTLMGMCCHKKTIMGGFIANYVHMQCKDKCTITIRCLCILLGCHESKVGNSSEK